jgi:predicted MFS family arabinose efflux permease
MPFAIEGVDTLPLPGMKETVKSYSPLKDRVFRRLFIAQVIALVGTGLSTVALTLLAYNLAGGNAAEVLGMALAIKMIAYVAFAPVVGGIAHRLSRKPLLIVLDLLRSGIILAMPFAASVWQIYVLIFLLNLLSAGFKPVFQALIPDVLSDEEQYTRALSLSRFAYDLENLLSPALAGLALLFLGFTSLFIANAFAFCISAALIWMTILPASKPPEREAGIWNEISFGLRSYLRTPRLRGMLVLYLGVACASSMVIVNTVVYVRHVLGGSEAQTALALAVSGAGSMLAALGIPRLLNYLPDRSVMLGGSLFMGVVLILLVTQPSYVALMPLWFMIGFGWSLVQTPAGRVITRSSLPADRSAFFSAQFSLSHACWLLTYPIAGYLGTAVGISGAGVAMGIAVFIFTVIALVIWPSQEPVTLMHIHTAQSHEHLHYHEEHHQHTHEDWDGSEPHSHAHTHDELTHSHAFVIDAHHPYWPSDPGR